MTLNVKWQNMTQQIQRYQVAKKVTVVNAIVNTFLGIIKILAGWLGFSQALLADGVHSLADLVTDVLVLLAARAAAEGPDTNHPYGHGRIETAVTVFLGMFLVFLGIGIAYDALQTGFTVSHVMTQPYVLVVAIISLLMNEGLFHYGRHQGRQCGSDMLIANAWHHRTDALSSLIVLVGVAGTLMGFVWFDALAAVIVSVLIIKMGLKMAWQNLQELVDTAMDPARLQQIREGIQAVPGVVSVHELRSRSLAGRFFIDVHVQVSPKISVSEGHFVGDKVRHYLESHYAEIEDVTIHIDPEDDENVSLNSHLPLRQDIECYLYDHCAHLAVWPYVHNIQLHYLSGYLYLELFLDDSPQTRMRKDVLALRQQVEKALKSRDTIWLGSILIYRHVTLD